MSEWVSEWVCKWERPPVLTLPPVQDKYRLHFGMYSGRAGDALSGGTNMADQWSSSHNSMQFSTRDQDQDRYLQGSCAKENHGGWWYNRWAAPHRAQLGTLRWAHWTGHTPQLGMLRWAHYSTGHTQLGTLLNWACSDGHTTQLGMLRWAHYSTGHAQMGTLLNWAHITGHAQMGTQLGTPLNWACSDGHTTQLGMLRWAHYSTGHT